ncbi:hypothetical protein PN36_13035 [Candidatus Thiomargarita nelsonii]|uniref:Uncharacterized protein n=1 Tax=Candidatus Thiomargarita nelsonii TaxID=1003181 RepID=A0A0A6RP64_9GAMM|nr:hypothetical protein PN36_13035 [Candidatus Thiomargarita nelsonii]
MVALNLRATTRDCPYETSPVGAILYGCPLTSFKKMQPHILVVEDEAAIREMLATVPSGYERLVQTVRGVGYRFSEHE